MSDDYVQIRFAYRGGDHADLERQHQQAFDDHAEFGLEGVFVESPIGDLKISASDVPEITGMSHLENYEHETESEDDDLLYAPLIDYWLGDVSLLTSSGDDRSDALDTLAEIVATGYLATDERPIAVYAETPAHAFRIDEAGTPPFTAESLDDDEYHHLSWLTVFPPEMVEEYGRDTLLSAPAWRTTELDDGGVLLICHDDVTSTERNCRDVAEHVGLPSYEDIS